MVVNAARRTVADEGTDYSSRFPMLTMSSISWTGQPRALDPDDAGNGVHRGERIGAKGSILSTE